MYSRTRAPKLVYAPCKSLKCRIAFLAVKSLRRDLATVLTLKSMSRWYPHSLPCNALFTAQSFLQDVLHGFLHKACGSSSAYRDVFKPVPIRGRLPRFPAVAITKWDSSELPRKGRERQGPACTEEGKEGEDAAACPAQPR